MYTIKLKKISRGERQVLLLKDDKKSQVHIGEFICDVDGFFYFFPKSGCWNEHMLFELSNKLREINAKWANTIDKYFTINTGTVITKNHKQLNFGQTVDVLNKQKNTYVVKAHGDSVEHTVHKDIIWLSKNYTDFEAREKALAKNGVYNYIS